MLDNNFKEMPLKERLDAQIEALKEVHQLYEDLIYTKKFYEYEYRIEAIECQLHALYNLRDGEIKNVNAWLECYQEDLAEYNRKSK